MVGKRIRAAWTKAIAEIVVPLVEVPDGVLLVNVYAAESATLEGADQ